METGKKLPLWPALVHAKCPRCRRGDMFTGSMYGFSTQTMFERCSRCNLTYEIEPGYFYAAMFISYAINIAEMVAVALTIDLLSGSRNPWIYAGTALYVSAMLSRFNFRYSRVVLL